METTCTCQCGRSSVTVQGEPITRLICHCQICQAIYRGPYSDVTLWWKGAVRLPSGLDIHFARYRSPPAVLRGTCPQCGLPVVGFLRVAPFATLAFIPAMNFPEGTPLPMPFAHIFYHRRQHDIEDALPKFSGYWPSKWAATKEVGAAVLGIARSDRARRSHHIQG